MHTLCIHNSCVLTWFVLLYRLKYITYANRMVGCYQQFIKECITQLQGNLNKVGIVCHGNQYAGRPKISLEWLC